LKFVAFYFKKVYYYWWFSPQSGILYPKRYLDIYKCLYSFALLLSLLGAVMAVLFRGKVMRGNALLLICVFMSICFTQSFFYVEGRHRWLIEPILFIFFSYGVMVVCEFFRKKVRPMSASTHI